MIRSESGFFWGKILFLVKLPFLIILCLIGKCPLSEITGPIKDISRFIFEPRATISLILLNCLMFVVQLRFLGVEGVIRLAFRPSDIFDLNILNMLVSVFMHASLAHLFGNMLFLFIFGRIVEKEIGSARMLAVYGVSAAVSLVVSGLMGQGGIGASGAIAGLISASILLNPFYFTYLLGIPMPVLLVGWMAILADISGILIPTDDGVGRFAHLGGYLAVSIFVFLLGKGERSRMMLGLVLNILFVILGILAYFYFGGLFPAIF